jgi:hypothetical protein
MVVFNRGLHSLVKKTALFPGLLQAADGTRTHDLLHGKQTVGTANDAGNGYKFDYRGGSTPRADPGEKGPIRANTEPQRGRGSNRLAAAGSP